MKKQKELTPDQWQMQNMLQAVIDQFAPNPKERRSVNINKRVCMYNPPKDKPESIGCAIGMFLGTKTAKKLDKSLDCDSSIEYLIQEYPEILPTWIKRMNAEFLDSLQRLHDNENNWKDKGFTKLGILTIKDICQEYELDYKILDFTNAK
jgi:hypothetical protein